MNEAAGLATHPIGITVIAVLAGFGLVAAAKLYGLVFMRWKTPFRVGEQMKDVRAEVVEWSGGEGYVSADGELWRALSSETLAPGDKVSVISVDGLSLTVKKESA